ncbi:competence protein ComEC [Caldalkalibacillus uzonensis]|uniref:Competence protein ComEC n=1 Tax=Caldalkalibacillus uzonensis TaxID=353224 RepID=A0ABU0CTD1_9BACI|nr:competence protein ComEC [Caldalkalibacillus uzonensis]
MLALLIWRKELLYPADHPHVRLRKRHIGLGMGMCVLLMLFNIYFSVYISNHQQSAIDAVVGDGGSSEQIALKGLVLSPAQIDGNRVRFELRVQEIDAQPLNKPEKVVVTHYVRTLEERESYEHLKRGDIWEGIVRLAAPQTARNPGAFDYRRYLKQRGIHYVAQVRGTWAVQPGDRLGDRVLGMADQYRLLWISQTEKVFGEATAPIIQTMTVGYRDEMDKHVMEMYQYLGLIHLLAISGLHVGIVLGSLYLLLSRLPLTRETIYLILFIFIPVYMMLSGWQVSAVRASLMALVVLLCLRFRLWHHSLVGLYVVYLLVLMVNPYYLYHVGFQLSFAITFALLTVVPKLYPLLPGKGERLRQGMAVAIVAQAVSLPIIMYHFYSFSPLSPVLNLILVPLYSAIYIPAAFGLTLVSFLSLDLVRLPALLYVHSLDMLHRGLEWLYGLPWAAVHTGQPAWWWLLLTALLTVFVAFSAEQRQKYMVGLFLVMYPIFIAFQIMLPYLDRQGYVTVLDVGQGDAIVIEAPYRRQVVVVDLGGQLTFYQEEWQQPARPFEVGRDIILPYLRYRGINKVDKVVISHGHYDHFGGIQGLLGQMKIGMVLYPPVAPQSDFEQHWLRRIREEGIPVYFVSEGDSWRNSEIHFKVIFPPSPERLVEHVNNLHDYNVVLWNKIYETTFLWTGDVEEAGEHAIVDTYPAVKADVLKVAHHGSRTSTSHRWLEQVKPRVSVISVGTNNRYGHPDAEVVQRLQESGTHLFQTDQHGGILIVIGPGQYTVRPTLQAETESVQ